MVQITQHLAAHTAERTATDSTAATMTFAVGRTSNAPGTTRFGGTKLSFVGGSPRVNSVQSVERAELFLIDGFHACAAVCVHTVSLFAAIWHYCRKPEAHHFQHRKVAT